MNGESARMSMLNCGDLFGGIAEGGLGHAWPAAISAALSSWTPVARKTIASSVSSALRNLAGDAAVAHDDDPVAEADQFLHLGRDDDDGAALLGQARR